ncbi:hypothetical protein CVT24_002610 [Panaeolus cyanescens]|uniref:Uncharacterized protein n=1 Tax=Panaeolus cyanescens TaxID=181874 RepID=A0A409YU27_9AGAR|nr:hypothetical protein CVT24_002610 [Panaeolus cyanescens]
MRSKSHHNFSSPFDAWTTLLTSVMSFDTASTTNDNKTEQKPWYNASTVAASNPSSYSSNKDDNILNEICGPAMPLPIDEQYYIFPDARPPADDHARDYTFGVIPRHLIDIEKYGRNKSTKGYITTELEYDCGQDVDARPTMALNNMTHSSNSSTVIQSTSNSTYGIESTSWEAARDYSYGVDLSYHYGFHSEDETSGWPVPNNMYVTPQSVDTISRVH